MHGRIKSATNELTIVVTSDDLGYTKQDAIADAAEYVAKIHPCERWEFIDVELDKYNAWSVRYRRQAPGPNERRTIGPSWDVNWSRS